MESRASQIIEDMREQSLVEVLRALQTEEGHLGREALQGLAGSKLMSLDRLYGIAASYPEFQFDEDEQGKRPRREPVSLPGFAAVRDKKVHSHMLVPGPLTSRYDKDATSLQRYRELGGLSAIGRLDDGMKPEQVLSEVLLGELTRRHGIWQRVATYAGERVIVANNQTGDPLAGQVSALLAQDPYAFAEGIYLAAYATGAREGYLFLGPRYAHLSEPLSAAAADVKLVSGIDFELEVVTGPGVLVSSEDSVPLAALQGERPVPVAEGKFSEKIWSRPVLVENAGLFTVLAAVLGTGERVNNRLYQVTGEVSEEGVIEAPAEMTVAELIGQAGSHGRPRVLVGGLSGTFVSGDGLEQPLSEYERSDNPRWRTLHVLAADDDAMQMAGEGAAYNARYLCGHCIPCRIGTLRMAEILAAPERDLDTLAALAATLEKSGLCTAGRGAGALVRSAIEAGS